MKFITTFLAAFVLLLLVSCSGKEPAQRPVPPSVNALPTDPPPSLSSDAMAAGSGVQHYICPNNCQGSGGAQSGTCPVCGSQYVHNAAYHDQTTPAPATDPMIQQTQVAQPSLSTGGAQHYICPNNCQGSGGAQSGTCPVCGSQYVHNAAYHNQSTPAATNNPVAAPSIQAPQLPASAQNSAGAYHYICSKGCAGGSGSAGNCAQCGAPLAHNQAFHQ